MISLSLANRAEVLTRLSGCLAWPNSKQAFLRVPFCFFSNSVADSASEIPEKKPCTLLKILLIRMNQFKENVEVIMIHLFYE